MFVAVTMLAACNNNEKELDSTITELTKEQVFLELNSQIDKYNSTFVLQYSPPEFSLLKKWNWGRIWKIAKADLSGGVAGATVGGLAGPGGKVVGALIGATIFSMAEVSATLETTSSSSYGIVGGSYCLFDMYGNYYSDVNDLKNNFAFEDNIGYYHNLIIEELIKENPDIINASMDELLNAVLNKVKLHFPAEMSNFDVIKFKNQIKSNLNNDLPILLTEDNPFPALSANYPQLQQEFKVIEEYVNTVSSLQPKLQPVYSAGFISIIKQSNISDFSLFILNSAIAVGVNSSVLWVKE